MSQAAIALGVNIDHVASLRQARLTAYPDPVHAAYVAQMAGAQVITFHLREDRRHIQMRDVDLLKKTVSCRTNLEMAATEEMLLIAEKIKPDDCCLVPENRHELTTEGGLDVQSQKPWLSEVIARLSQSGIRVSLFIDPQSSQVEAALECGAPVVELHTGAYAQPLAGDTRTQELQRLIKAAAYANRCDLVVNAGHGLDYSNVSAVAAIAEISELNIGHAILARALFSGLENAILQMLHLMQAARR